MRKQLLIILITFLSSNCFSQISFEKGYFINNNEQKIECLIKNIDWNNNPTEFEYRLSINTEEKIATIKLLKEFGVYNDSKYIRGIVNIDRSTKKLNDLSTNRNPVFKEEELFLKVLVEGQSNLYSYVDGNLVRFFYSKDNSNNIEQLVFKYYKSSGDLIGENNRFKQQILNDLKCENIKEKDIKNISYVKNDLVNLFVKYNNCNNSEGINFEEKQKKDLFNLTIRPRLNSSSLLIQISDYTNWITDFGNETSIGFGLETEFILSFNKNKWSIIIEPAYQSFKSKKEGVSRNVTVDYKSIQLAVGLRHYFFINNNAKFFINASYLRDFQKNSMIDFDPGFDLDITTTTGGNLGFGIGYKQNDKFSLELRLQTVRGVLNSYEQWSSRYENLSVIFGYSIF